MANAELTLKPISRLQNLCNIYVHQAGIGGGTTCPYEQLTPASPIVQELALQELSLSPGSGQHLE